MAKYRSSGLAVSSQLKLDETCSGRHHLGTRKRRKSAGARPPSAPHSRRHVFLPKTSFSSCFNIPEFLMTLTLQNWSQAPNTKHLEPQRREETILSRNSSCFYHCLPRRETLPHLPSPPIPHTPCRFPLTQRPQTPHQVRTTLLPAAAGRNAALVFGGSPTPPRLGTHILCRHTPHRDNVGLQLGLSEQRPAPPGLLRLVRW